MIQCYRLCTHAQFAAMITPPGLLCRGSFEEIERKRIEENTLSLLQRQWPQ